MIRLTWVVVLLLTLSGCGKEKNQVPDVPVNLILPLTDPRLTNLNSPGGAVSFTGYGVAGIIIYRSATSGYRAYDRCSTVNPEKRCAVVLDAGAFSATDPCSGAKYSLEDGNPAKAPATVALRQYTVIITGNNIQVVN